MADTFGVKLTAEGEKEFKSALFDLNAAFKVAKSEMALVASQFDKSDKSMAAVTARSAALNKEMDAQKDKIQVLEAALQKSADSYGEADRRTQKWQAELNNAKAALNGMEGELKQNEGALKDVAEGYNDAEKQAEQFADAVDKSADKAEASGGKLQKLGGALKGIGAAMGTAFVAVGAATVGAVKGLTDMTVGAAQYADDILTMSTVTGMSTESLQGYKYAAELVDVSMETLTGSMAKQVKSMSNARNGSKNFVAAYDKLGVSVTDANGTLRDSDTVYWETIDALGEVKNETERDALAMQLFGKSAQDLNPLIAQGSAGIKDLTEEAKQMGAVMSDDQLMSLGKFDDSVQRLKSGSAAAKNALGMVLLPQLQSLADNGVSLIGDFTRGLNEAGGDWGKISEVIGNAVGGIASMILSNMPQIMDVAVNIITSIGTAITDNLPLLIESAISIMQSLIGGLIEALPLLAEGAVQLLLGLVQAIIENLPMLIEAAIQVIVTLANGIAEALPTLIPAIVEAIILIITTLYDNMPLLLEAGFKLLEGLAMGLINAIPTLVSMLPQIIGSILTYMTESLPRMLEMGVQLIGNLAMGLLQAIGQVGSAIGEIVSSIFNSLGNAVSGVVDIGRNIVQGLWNGISGMGEWLWGQVSGFFGGLVDNVKGFLGIASPSKLFAGIGGYMGEGIGVGFVGAMHDVQKDMQNAIPTDFDLTGSMESIKSSIATDTNATQTIIHTGTIRVEGIDSKGSLLDVVEIIINQMRQEVRV